MKQLADGVWQLSGFPPNAINVFVIEDVLIDASTRYATRRILRQSRATGSPPTRSPTPIPTTRAPATTSASGSGSRSGSARPTPTRPSARS